MLLKGLKGLFPPAKRNPLRRFVRLYILPCLIFLLIRVLNALQNLLTKTANPSLHLSRVGFGICLWIFLTSCRQSLPMSL
ncbi:AEC family transporter [uncultured Eubacterium sp.]|uniref:AEC family transporter n=1 Tax=uncultured Eubacterium sp. TaxID=165185 RepID=UPI0035A6D0CA